MHVRVMTYNIHRAIGIDRRFRPDRIARIVAHHDADVVLLQEVDVGVPRSRRMNLAAKIAELAHYPHFAVGLNVKLRTGMYGNATLSRFPILKEKNIDLTIELKKARGCLFTTLKLPKNDRKKNQLAVFNLHLGISFNERPRQLGILFHSPQYTALAAETPCLVAGDFNDWVKRLAPMLTEILDFTCATNHGWGYQNAFLTYPSFSPSGGLDKIFCRGGIRVVNSRCCRLKVSKIASDHLPMVADLRI